MNPVQTVCKGLIGLAGSGVTYLAMSLASFKEWAGAVGMVLGAMVSLAMLANLLIDLRAKFRAGRK